MDRSARRFEIDLFFLRQRLAVSGFVLLLCEQREIAEAFGQFLTPALIGKIDVPFLAAGMRQDVLDGGVVAERRNAAAFERRLGAMGDQAAACVVAAKRLVEPRDQLQALLLAECNRTAWLADLIGGGPLRRPNEARQA